MAILNQAFAGGAHIVARAIEYQIRQASTTTTSSPIDSATPSPGSSISSSPSGTPFPTLSSASSPPPTETSLTNSGDNDQGGGNNSGTSSPLLFFVALGFGVVFTNLWIIVGVKYCFRYNARNRQMRGLDENGEPINLDNMPTRPHRRRREKKLMTMDEVNDKFPMMKYKTWVSDRAREGLPTTGGVSAPASRANSVQSVEGIVPELPSKERDFPEDHSDDNATPRPGDKDNAQSSVEHPESKVDTNAANGTENPDTRTDTPADNGTVLTQAQTAGSIITKDPDHRASIDEDDDDEHINAALPPELMGTAGDTCAICIDTLEDNDDVRGLTCGHAFHAVCLDPWLTNRRACCPLCKADYYTPKPRPPPADGDPTSPTSPHPDPSRNNNRMNMPRSPQRTFTSWGNFRGPPRGIFLGRFGGTGRASTNYGRQPRIWERQRPGQPQRRQADSRSAGAEGPSFAERVRDLVRVANPRRREEDERPATTADVTVSGANGGAGTATTTTPSQLEAGVRPPGAASN
ncbi:hypothetical protein F4779DRAFT_20433 [Xylariaceae sp. FL0662B]|nr:hypothetical protein F4779DRAFT_20433 [Xylariaceae sp. FL0662B]